jgi:hypothetical protein
MIFLREMLTKSYMELSCIHSWFICIIISFVKAIMISELDILCLDTNIVDICVSGDVSNEYTNMGLDQEAC